MIHENLTKGIVFPNFVALFSYVKRKCAALVLFYFREEEINLHDNFQKLNDISVLSNKIIKIM